MGIVNKKNMYAEPLNADKKGKDELSGFVEVCKLENLKEKEGKRFLIDDVDVALFKIDGKVRALSNICPHQKAAMIYDGFVEDGKVACPLHGWEFSLETGNIAEYRRGLDCYEVKIKDGVVYVKVFKRELNW